MDDCAPVSGGKGGGLAFEVTCKVLQRFLLIEPKLPISWRRARLMFGEGETRPGDRFGVRSENTRDTCWSRMSWSVSSSTCSFWRICSAKNLLLCELVDWSA